MPLLHFDLLKTSLSINLNPSQQLLYFDSILEELTLYKEEMDLDSLGAEPIRIFAENPLIPGLIIRQQSQFIGMVSRRRFFEYMSRPYSLELFTKRPFSVLYQFLQTDFLVFSSKTSIVEAVHRSLNRSPELVYEPLVVETLPGVFYILDMEQLLLASSLIHELAMEDLTESQLDLVKQKSLLRATLESTADGILVVDRDNKIVNFNQKFVQMWRIPASIIATRDDGQALAFAMEQLKDGESFLSKVNELYSQPEADSFDLLEFKDGRVFERYSQPERLGEEILGRVWSFRDVTERKQTELALRKSEERYRLLIETTSEGVWMFDSEGKIVFANGRITQMLGYTLDEILGKPLETFGDEENQAILFPCSKCCYERAGNVFDCKLYRQDGSHFWALISANPVFDDDGQYAGCLGMVTDITDRKLMEESLRRGQERMKLAQEIAKMGSWDWNLLTGSVTYSEQLGSIVGLPPGISHPTVEAFLDSIHPEDREYVAQHLTRAIEKGEDYTIEFRAILPDGTLRWINSKGKVYFNQSGKPIRVIGVGMDITDRKLSESALLLSERTLRNHNRVLAKLTKSKTLNGKDLNNALREITEAAAHTLKVERVSVWLYNQDRSKIHCLDLYENSQQKHSAGFELAAVNYPAYFQAWEQVRVIAAHDAHTDSRTQELSEFYLTPLGVTNLLDAPIRLHGEVVGVLCYENVGLMRQWTLEEENFAAAIADLVSLSIETDKRKQAEETIRHQALHDHLTGLPNRTLFSDRLSIALANARRHKEMLAVMFLDLDRFKTINDTLGHDVGDLLLKAVVERVKDCLRQGDTIARWGGDEFTLLLPQIGCKKYATNIAQRIIDALKPVFNLNGYELRISLSIGIAVYPSDGEDAETLLKNADVALYRTKEDGRNGYQVYSLTMNSQASELLTMENNLHQALEREEFVLHYQPQINIATGKITGMEALVRWQHPEFGLVSPATFIPLAEQTGLIVPIGEWALWTACTQNKAWQDAGLPKLRMAVNLSARQLQQSNLIEIVEQILSETGLEPEYLELEVTESVTMQNLDLAKTVITNLYNMGIQLSIDDFGTGYSSLSYLKLFPFQTLKIDRSFVRDLNTNPKDAAIITVIIALGKELNLRLIAEGVETEEQKDLLRCLQCEEMQGYLFSRPLPAKGATELLQQSGRDTQATGVTPH